MRLTTISPVSSSVEVSGDPAVVFDYLSDPLNQREWTPNFLALVDGPHGGPGLGTRYRGKLRGFGVVDFVIDQYEPGHAFRVATGPKLIPLTHRFAVEPAATGGARIDHVVTCVPRGPMRLLAPLLGVCIRLMVLDLNRQMRKVINGSRRSAGSQAGTPGAAG